MIKQWDIWISKFSVSEVEIKGMMMQRPECSHRGEETAQQNGNEVIGMKEDQKMWAGFEQE